jgi:hypothetical protein
MTKVLDRLRRPLKALPEDLSSLEPERKRGALIARQGHVKTLAREAKRASTSKQREAIKTELTTVVAEIGELREAGATIEPHRATIATFGGKRTQAEAVVAVIANNWLLPSELAGLTLHPEYVSEEEASELLDLLKLRHHEGVRLDAGQTARLRSLVERLAGWACFAELDARREIERLVEEVRLDSLPKRVEYAEIGSVHLPASVFAGLRSAVRSRKDGWRVADVGSLTVILSCFEAQDASLIEGGRFEESDGEKVLVGKGRELRFSKRAQPPFDAIGASKVDVDERWLAKSGWLTFTHAGTGRVEVRLGPKAKALREGRS